MTHSPSVNEILTLPLLIIKTMKPIHLDLNNKQAVHLITLIRNYAYLPDHLLSKEFVQSLETVIDQIKDSQFATK